MVGGGVNTDVGLSSQLAAVMLPEEENFLLLFRRETPLDNSVEFMRVRSKGQPIHHFQVHGENQLPLPLVVSLCYCSLRNNSSADKNPSRNPRTIDRYCI